MTSFLVFLQLIMTPTLQDMEVNYFHAYIDGVDFVFIDTPMFRHIENNIYGGNHVVGDLSFEAW